MFNLPSPNEKRTYSSSHCSQQKQRKPNFSELRDYSLNERLNEMMKKSSFTTTAQEDSIDDSIYLRKTQSNNTPNHSYYNRKLTAESSESRGVILPSINNSAEPRTPVKSLKPLFQDTQSKFSIYYSPVLKSINKISEDLLDNSPSNYLSSLFKKENNKGYQYSNFSKQTETECISPTILLPSSNTKPSFSGLMNTKSKMNSNNNKDYINNTAQAPLSNRHKRFISFDPQYDTKPKENNNNFLCNKEEEQKPIIRLIETEVIFSKNEDELFTINNYYCLSQNGQKANGSDKINQDSYLECPQIYNKKTLNIFGVLDGHGENGDKVSQFVGNYLKEYYTNDQSLYKSHSLEEIYQKYSANNYEYIKQGFISAENVLKRKIREIDSNMSGTTCVIVFQIGNKLICANAGDSRAIMIMERKTIVPLSLDHKPNNPIERQRIEQCKGEVRQDGGKEGPYRVFAKGQVIPGIAMSRSIGDLLASSLGVIPIPDIKEIDINEDVKYVIIASDSLWEFMSNEKVASIARKYYKYKNPQKLCEVLLQKAIDCWRKKDDTIDDITIISIFF